MIAVLDTVRGLLHAQLGTYRRPCPACDRGPKDSALSVTVDARGALWHCHRCGSSGALTHEGNTRGPAPTARPVAAMPLDWSLDAARIWKRTEPLRGTLGAKYLETRGCRLPPADSDLRYLPPQGDLPPSLCAAITDVLTGRRISLHFTRLRADGSGKAGTGRDKLLLKGHRKRGGCIRLWPDESVTTGLAIAEGLETALAAAHRFTPIWATVDCANLAAFPVLAGIESLTIYADHDPAGIAAARACARRWRDAGREVNARVPKQAGQDVADIAAAIRARRSA